MKLVLSFSVLWLVLFSGCTSREALSAKGSNVSDPTSPVNSDAAEKSELRTPDSEDNPKLAAEINKIAATAKGKVGVAAAVLDGSRETGAGRQGTALVSLNPHERFPMQSVYKLPISMAVMKQFEAGKFKLSDKIEVTKGEMVGRRAYSPIRDRHPNGTTITVEGLLRYAIADSDGTASDVLMRIAGGPSAIQAYLTELGIKDMIVLDTEQTLSQDESNTVQYRNYSTPAAAVALLRALHERRGMSEASQALLLKFMTESKPGQKRLKGLLPAGTNVAHKTGTSNTDKGLTAATNDIGIIALPNGKQIAIAVFVADSSANQETREGVIAKIAKAIYDALSAEHAKSDE